MKAAVITISTSRAARGEGGEGGEDLSGPALAAFATGLGLEVVAQELIPDDQGLIEERLRHWADEERCELVLTSGGTGFSPTDVTPEATRRVILREAPGIAEALRSGSREHTPHWMLSRAVAGIREKTLIVNFPGSPRSIEQAGAAIEDALPHALKLLAGEADAH